MSGTMQWTARADWIDAEDGTVVCLGPAMDRISLPTSIAAWPERRALIAAAPELLAALKMARDYIREHAPMHEARHDGAIRINAAIAAAEARS